MGRKTVWVLWVFALGWVGPALAMEIDTLAKQARGTDVKQARAAIKELSTRGAEGLPHMITALDHPEYRVHGFAYSLLLDARENLRPHAQDLVNLLTREETETLTKVLNLLGPIKAGIPEARASLRTSTHPRVQQRLVRLLGYMGPAASLATEQVAALATSPDRGVRLAVAEALGGFRTPRPQAISALETLLRNTDPYLQKVTAKALQKLAKEEPAAVECTIPLLIETLRVKDARGEAQATLEALGSRALDPLLNSVATHKSGKVRLWSAMLLGSIEGAEDRVFPVLVDLIDSKDFSSVLGALTGLSTLGSKASSAAPLIEAVATGAHDVGKNGGDSLRAAALRALVRLAPDRALDLMLSTLSDESALVRNTSAAQLKRLAKTHEDDRERIQHALTEAASREQERKAQGQQSKTEADAERAAKVTAAEAAADKTRAELAKARAEVGEPAEATPATDSAQRLAEEHPERVAKLTANLRKRVERWIKARDSRVLQCRTCDGSARVRCKRCRGTRKAVCPPCRGNGTTVQRVRGRRVRSTCSACRGSGRLDCPCKMGHVECGVCVHEGVAGYRPPAGHRAFYDFLSKQGKRGLKRRTFFREVVAGRALGHALGAAPGFKSATIKQITLHADRAGVELDVQWPDDSSTVLRTEWILQRSTFCLRSPRDQELAPLFE